MKLRYLWVDQQLKETEQRIRNLAQAVAAGGWSSALAEQLKLEEDGLAQMKARRVRLTSTKERAKVVLHPKTVEHYLLNLLDTLEKNPSKGRMLLKKHLGSVTMTPKVETARSCSRSVEPST